MDIVRVLDKFKWLTDMYIIDYFVEDNWKLIPKSWQDYFNDLIARSSRPRSNILALIEALLDKTCTKPWPKCDLVVPLSLMSLRAFACSRSFKHHNHVETPIDLARIFSLEVSQLFVNFRYSISVNRRIQ